MLGAPQEAGWPLPTKRKEQTHPAIGALGRSLARNLRQLRVANGMSQGQLATKSGMTRTHINRLENGTYNARLETIDKLAAALHVAALDLLSKDPQAFKKR
jgi:transcriptional regulator with XRE-family HTH domain